MNITPQQAAYEGMVLQEIRKELLNTYMIMQTEEDKRWYKYAIKALVFASPLSLNLSMNDYIHITDKDYGDDGDETEGINYMNIQILCNNIEMRTAKEMDMTIEDFQYLLKLNIAIAAAWNKVVKPLEEEVKKRIQTRMQLQGSKSSQNGGGRILTMDRKL